MRSASLEGGLIGLRGGKTSASASGLRSNVGVIEFEKKLPFADVITFSHEQAFDCSRDGRVGFEIFDRLDFAVGGDQTPYGAALNRCSTDSYGRSASGGKDNHCDKENERDPDPAPAQRRSRIIGGCQPMFFQCAAGKSASDNLPFRRRDDIVAMMLN
jgi:hypothetical protein